MYAESIVKIKTKKEFISEMKMKALLFDNTVSKFVQGTKSISSRSMIKKKIIAYKDSLIDFDALMIFTEPKYKDGVNALEDVLVAQRYIDTSLLVSTGECESVDYFQRAVKSSNVEVLFLGESYRKTLVVSPIKKKDAILGYDIICFDNSRIHKKIDEEFISFEILPREDNSTIIKDSLISEGMNTIIKIESKHANVNYKFSIKNEILYEDLKIFYRNQLVMYLFLLISIGLLIFIIYRGIKIISFKRSDYLKNLVDEKTSDLQLINEELKEAIATKDRFISILGHDLRSPFNSILGFSDLLMKNSSTYDQETIRQFAENINKSSVKTFNLLNNLLEWSKSQQGGIPFNPQTISINLLIQETCSLLNDFAEQKSIKLEIDTSSHVEAKVDVDMVKTVIRNLVSNAIKFTYENGVVTVAARKEFNSIQIIVTDSGTGMNEKTISSLFKIEESISKHGTKGESGTGFGLLLCKEFVDKHNGTIKVNSEIDKGSAFTVSLPI